MFLNEALLNGKETFNSVFHTYRKIMQRGYFLREVFSQFEGHVF